MRVYRGRRATRDADLKATAAVLAAAAGTGVPALRVWAPGRQLAFGRRDATEPGYERAKRAARERGFPPVERSVGGRAVAYAGTTLAFAHAVPLADPRSGLDDRYTAAVDTLVDALAGVGADVAAGEPPDSFCPGAHSVRAVGGGKVAGVAQRVRRGAALVAGCVVVAERAALRDVLVPVYGALGVPLDPDSVDSVADAGGPRKPERVRDAIERAFVAGRTVERADVREVPLDASEGSAAGVDGDSGAGGDSSDGGDETASDG
ncbi:lipoate--protein ligase family protein [Candidatus Halobonum tyrrellensis]|uniref:lipoate--protein ligase family protein n=1 Tax=Candidatus Halobonum tyrrellensis TaxID=1431545 RepID=UPI001F1A1363|nr:lipoate--protein ligase family protein [Candidatus Halobonum tyrrellensis]